MPKKTVSYEYEARKELINGIDDYANLSVPNTLLQEKFGINDIRDLNKLPFSKLIEIHDFLAELLCSPLYL